MKPLTEQSEFETLLGRNPDVAAPTGATVVYFTARWCGACRSVNKDALEASIPGVTWLLCDVDENNYTAGYCGVSAIPAFALVTDGKFRGLFQSNQNAKIVDWVKSNLGN